MRAWFQQDDFAWLGQGLNIATWKDLAEALFIPRAQGTIRPWSERLFFILFYHWFGLDPRPYHLWVAVTQVANLLLLQSIVLHLTRSRLAAVAAPILWLANVALATPLSWLSAYNEILCAFFLLLAFLLLLRWIETGRMRWFWWQTVVFILGFGALELNIVYPALAAAWCLLCARDHLRRVLWLFPISALYAVIHFTVAAKPAEGPYARHWDTSVIFTFLHYCGTALTGGLILPHWRIPPWSWQAAAWGMGLALLGYALWSWRRGERIPAFGILWFSISISPILPLRDHLMDYYLAVPSLGLAILLAVSLRDAFRNTWWTRVAVLGLVAPYLFLSIPVNRTESNWRWERGHRIRALVEGMERAHQLHPGKMILLTGLNSDLFWSGLFDAPHRLYGATAVYAAPGEEAHIEPHPELGDLSQWVGAKGTVARALANKQAVVYHVESTVLKNITKRYERGIPAEWWNVRPRIVHAGLAVHADDLGAGWHPADGDWRWMSARAEVRLAGPAKPSERLFLSGFCPESFVKQPLQLTVKANGFTLGEVEITSLNSTFESTFHLPERLVGQPEMVVELSVNRTVTLPGDGRALGLVFGRIGLR
jgi:hypothetical protein